MTKPQTNGLVLGFHQLDDSHQNSIVVGIGGGLDQFHLVPGETRPAGRDESFVIAPGDQSLAGAGHKYPQRFSDDRQDELGAVGRIFGGTARAGLCQLRKAGRKDRRIGPAGHAFIVIEQVVSGKLGSGKGFREDAQDGPEDLGVHFDSVAVCVVVF